jgi:hypothetical protein
MPTLISIPGETIITISHVCPSELLATCNVALRLTRSREPRLIRRGHHAESHGRMTRARDMQN